MAEAGELVREPAGTTGLEPDKGDGPAAAGDHGSQPAPDGQDTGPTVPDWGQTVPPERLGFQARQVRSQKDPEPGANPGVRGRQPPAGKPTKPTSPAKQTPLETPPPAQPSVGRIGQPEPIDYGKILKDPQVRAIFIGEQHPSRQAKAALIDALPHLVKTYGITDLALEMPREDDHLTAEERIAVMEEESVQFLTREHQDWSYAHAQRAEQRLIRLADSLGVRIWGLDLPYEVLESDKHPLAFWSERNQSFADAIAEHLEENARNDPAGNPGRVLALVGKLHVGYDPSFLRFLDTKRPEDASQPLANVRLAELGHPSVVVTYMTPDQDSDPLFGDDAQVSTMGKEQGGRPFMVQVHGGQRRFDWFVSPGIGTRRSQDGSAPAPGSRQAPAAPLPSPDKGAWILPNPDEATAGWQPSAEAEPQPAAAPAESLPGVTVNRQAAPETTPPAAATGDHPGTPDDGATQAQRTLAASSTPSGPDHPSLTSQAGEGRQVAATTPPAIQVALDPDLGHADPTFDSGISPITSTATPTPPAASSAVVSSNDTDSTSFGNQLLADESESTFAAFDNVG